MLLPDALNAVGVQQLLAAAAAASNNPGKLVVVGKGHRHFAVLLFTGRVSRKRNVFPSISKPKISSFTRNFFFLLVCVFLYPRFFVSGCVMVLSPLRVHAQ